jgi:hypothetical protein
MSNSLESYYLRQARGMPYFAGPLSQKGHGFGGIFRSIARAAVPLFKRAAPVVKSAAKAVAQEAARSGADVVSDLLSGKNLGKSLQERAEQATLRTAQRGARKLRIMSGTEKTRPRMTKRYKRAKVPRHSDIFA